MIGSWLGDPSCGRRALDLEGQPDNAWFVGHHPALKFDDGNTYSTYVVSIAGTASLYALLYEDMHVAEVVDVLEWVKAGIQTDPQAQRGTSTGTYIAYGTAHGVHKLASQPVPVNSAVGTGTLMSFLSSLPSTGTRVIITGYSLGGALAPAIAVTLLLSDVFKTFDPKNVLVYPVAGPSPGNDHFAELFHAKFPQPPEGSDYKWWNTNIINRLDIVPHFWCDDKNVSPDQNIFNVPVLYGLPPIQLISGVIDWLKKNALDISGITYKPIRSSPFIQDHPKYPENIIEFWDVAYRRHVREYRNHFGVSGFAYVPRDLREFDSDALVDKQETL